MGYFFDRVLAEKFGSCIRVSIFDPNDIQKRNIKEKQRYLSVKSENP